MRNLEILTKFSNILRDLGSPIETACLDEFGHFLFVFTKGDAKLHVFRYGGNSTNGVEIPSYVLKKKEVDLSDQDPYITEAKVESMDYI
jgi:hypothetical protein